MTSIGSLKVYWLLYLVTLFLGVLFIFVPIVRDFHLETASITALLFTIMTVHVAFIDQITDRLKFILVYTLQFLFTMPIAIGAVFSGCFGLEGIYFQLLIPCITIGFVLILSLYLRQSGRWIKKYHLMIIVVFLATVPPLVSLKLFPHLFIFNIIWGWFPGPIYDESVIIGLPLIWHRAFVILLSALLFSLHYNPKKLFFAFPFVLTFIILLHITNWKNFGIVHPIGFIEESLGGKSESENVILIYEKGSIPEDEIQYWVFWHEYHLNDLKEQLKVDELDTKIISFLYTDGWQKQNYTGARRTSYVPVWNKRDQIHIDRQSGAAVLRHELVHVLLKSSANPLIGASINIGLTEGVAGAFDDPRFRRMTNSEVIVNSGFEPEISNIKKVFSFLGFYTGRSSVNYAISGSFIGFLLDQGYTDEFKCAYKGGSFRYCFGSDFEDVFNSWKQHINSIPADSSYQPFAAELFSRESLFERKCARIPSKIEIQLNTFQKLRTRGQDMEALAILEELLSDNPQSISLWNTFTYINLQKGQPDKVYEYTKQELIDNHPTTLLRLADAAFMMGDLQLAKKTMANYIEFTSSMESEQALLWRGFTFDEDRLLSDFDKWDKYISLIYNPSSVKPTTLSYYSADQINLWLSLIRSQPDTSYVDMKTYVPYLDISLLSRDNLLYLADVLILFADNSVNDNNLDQQFRLSEILTQLEYVSHSLIHREQVKLLYGAIGN